MTTHLHHGECLAYMATLATGSIDAIIADPPYLTTNLHFDKAPSMDWPAWWDAAWRVVKPSGVVVLFAADLFTVDLILTQRANYRYRLVWEKTSAQGFLDANRRPLKAHEDILVFARQPNASTYNPQKTKAKSKRTGTIRRTDAGHYSAAGDNEWQDSGERFPVSVLKFGSIKKQESLHPTQKPTDLMRWLVRTYTNTGDTVLDCFAGSGSTLAACLLEGRNGIGCELDAGYYAKATARLQALAAAPMLAFAPA